MAQSPFILTGKIDTIPIDSGIPKILSNPDIATMHQTIVNPRNLWWDDVINTTKTGTGTWIGEADDVEGGLYLTLFAFTEVLPTTKTTRVNISVSFAAMGVSPELETFDVHDMILGRYVASLRNQTECQCVEFEVHVNDARGLLLTPGSYKRKV